MGQWRGRKRAEPLKEVNRYLLNGWEAECMNEFAFEWTDATCLKMGSLPEKVTLSRKRHQWTMHLILLTSETSQQSCTAPRPVSCFHSCSRGWLGAATLCCCPASGQSVTQCVGGLQKGRRSKFKVWLLLKAPLWSGTIANQGDHPKVMRTRVQWRAKLRLLKEWFIPRGRIRY